MVRHSCLGSILNHENDAVATINTNHFSLHFRIKLFLPSIMENIQLALMLVQNLRYSF